MAASRGSWLVTAAIAACGSGDPPRPHGQAPLIHPRDAAALHIDAAPPDAHLPWPELATFPPIEPLRVIDLPVRTELPRFDVGGPVLLGDLAIVSSSQFGFLAVDYHRGTPVWTKPAGLRVAPPLVAGGAVLLIGECVRDQPVPEGHVLLGCLRVVTPTGADQAYLAIHGAEAALAAFAAAAGAQHVWPAGDHQVRWRRGDHAVVIDTVSGVATATTAIEAPPVAVTYKGRTWEVTRDAKAGQIIAREGDKESWRTSRSYGALLTAVYLPDQAPMIRLANHHMYARHAEVNLFDIDATGSLHGQVSFPVPGIDVLGAGASSIGDVALAVRLDSSLRRDFIVGYAANDLLMWVYPLPEITRADPVGVAVSPDAVVVFHDGDTLTVLPELSARPDTPGAARAPLENPTQ